MARLYNPDRDAVLGLNPTGMVLWRALERPHTYDQLLAHLLENCTAVPADQVAADVAAFLEALLPRGFVGLVLEPGEMARAAEIEAGSGGQESPATSDPPGPEIVAEECERYYRGRSMLGTFRPGDRMITEPVSLAAVRCGDVVLFRRGGLGGAQREVAHRVVARLPGGLVTQGDNNPRADRAPVTEDRLVGRVTRLDRAGQVHPVRGGQRGLFHARAIRAARLARRLAGSLLRSVARPFYRRLREGRLVRRLWRPEITRLLVTTRRDPVVKYLVGGRTVARWWPESGRFGCRRPYDLLIGPPPREGGNHS